MRTHFFAGIRKRKNILQTWRCFNGCWKLYFNHFNGFQQTCWSFVVKIAAAFDQNALRAITPPLCFMHLSVWKICVAKYIVILYKWLRNDWCFFSYHTTWYAVLLINRSMPLAEGREITTSTPTDLLNSPNIRHISTWHVTYQCIKRYGLYYFCRIKSVCSIVFCFIQGCSLALNGRLLLPM